MGGNYRFINYTLTCNHYGINNYLNDIPAPEPFNSNDVEEWINNKLCKVQNQLQSY